MLFDLASGGEERLTRAQLESLVRWFVETGQVASSSLVVESDVKYPAQEFTQKTISQVTDAVLKDAKVPDGPTFTREDSAAVLASIGLSK